MGLLEVQVPAGAPAAGATLVGPCRSASVESVSPLVAASGARLDNGSRMSREAHVRFCESGGVRFPSATHLLIGVIGSKADAQEIMRQVVAFLHDQLKLEASAEKSKVSKASEGAVFLGHRIVTLN